MNPLENDEHMNKLMIAKKEIASVIYAKRSTLDDNQRLPPNTLTNLIQKVEKDYGLNK